MILSLLIAQGDWGWDGHMGWGDGWWVVMVAGMILFWGLIAAGLVWLVRETGSRRGRDGGRGEESDPLALLDRRLAEGTISPDDYRQRREILTGKPGDGSGGDSS